MKLPKTIPVFPLSNFIIFPKTAVPLNIFEPRYIDMVNDSMKADKFIGMVQPKVTKNFDDNKLPSLHKVGCLGKITSFKEADDGRYLIDLKGVIRFEIKKEIVGEKGKLLTENLEISVSFHNENPISVELPNQVKCKIEITDVALKGQTVSSSYKPATLDNGLNIQVPPFIESGDTIVIDTRNLEYVKKI